MRAGLIVGGGYFGVALLTALIAPNGQADAKAIAFSSLEISGFQITSGATIIDVSTVQVSNTTTSAATLDGTSTANSAPVNGAPGSPVANSDVLQSCLGACGGIGQNSFTAFHAVNPGQQFARGDAVFTGSILVPGGAGSRTVAETQLTGAANSSGGGGAQSIVNFSTIDFEPGEGGDLTFSFHALGELLAFSDEISGVAIADFDFSVSLRDITNGGSVEIGVTSNGGETGFDSLNVTRSAFGIGQEAHVIDDTFFLTATGLLSNTAYRLLLSQNADVSARAEPTTAIPEPGMAALLGFGALGLVGLARRRRLRF